MKTETSKPHIKREYFSLIGCKIVAIRPLTEAECKEMAWDYEYEDWAVAIICDNGKCFIPSSDPEGNSAGFLMLGQIEK